MQRSLSTTSYAVLGMLAIRPFTPYELTQQVRRSLRYCWPVSERRVYNEPERLVADGLAHVELAHEDRRVRRTYSITPLGRDALATWLSTPPSPPTHHAEALLRVVFADQGSTGDLLESIAKFRSDVAALRQQGAQQMGPYLNGHGPFTDRAHLVAMFADLYNRMFTAMEEWATEATAEINTWPTTRQLGLTTQARNQLETVVNGLQSRP